MSVIFVGGVLFGTILGRFFRIFVLVPASALAVVLVLATPAAADKSLWDSMLELFVLVTSMQVGYVVGLVSGAVSPLEQAHSSWNKNAATSGSRSYHLR
jgi:ABC-type dipeptide/oligopeptide/nickel transport system permease subunit